ncbi:alpha/beta hydrolase [Arenimonas alkanexedens]
MDENPAFPSESGPLHLTGPAGRLELMVDLPEPGQERTGVAVLCHPNPPEGGTLHNKVVTMTARALSELGVAAVRFNFRGVGQSEGSFDDGRGEILDLLAVTDWVRKVRPNDALWLAGFSFGSWVALQGARQLPVKQMISIAPPVGLRAFDGVMAPTCPWLVVMPEADDVVEPQKVYDWIDSLQVNPTLVRMPDTGHFFHRRLMDLRGAIKNGVRKNLPPPRHG